MTTIEPVRFGTDGLRGRAGAAPMDPETLRRVGAALGVLLQRSGGEQKRVLVGDDGRDSAPWILDALAQGLVAAEVAITDVALCTTPALAFLTRTQPFDAGIMISASHNPAADNGVKIFAGDGRKLSDEDERELERLAAELRPATPKTPRVKSNRDLLRRYDEGLAQKFPDLDLTGLRVGVDAANGGGSELAPRILRAFGAEVIELACEPDGFNINEGVGALHPERMAAAVGEQGFDLGVCLDGDGDRGIFVDEQGTVRDGDDVLCLFGLGLHRSGRLPGDVVVATVMSNLGLHKALGAAGVGAEITPVGDRNVWLAMQRLGAALGGEQSGHVLFLDNELVGDGLYTALRLLELRSAGGAALSRQFAEFHRFPQRLVNVPVAHKPALEDVPAIAAKVREIEAALGDDGRLLLRYSGTEPKCRVMIEAADEAVTVRLCDELAAVVAAEIGT
ncbi:MAG: phosphoglucosamine mutase [Planctomycetes bacterium]|nr:phosphoglucosamine mutase [Planctomycetota bacterium]